jgi:uncharacterized protein with ParB-like and HNH nuclease domain
MSEHIDTPTDEVDDTYSNDDLYNISTWGADLSFRELITMYDEEELVKPELQRKYVWDKTEASRFIDSLLMGLPVPSIFLAQTGDNTKLIIDGYQRIMTVHDFVKGIWKKDDSVFQLTTGKGINERWRGKSFTQLTDSEQRKIKSTTIHAIIFEQKHPKKGDTSLYQIFERINTSGTTLLPQEIRNCVSQGTFNALLFELNKNPDWRALFGMAREDDRMRDVEFILRFLALYDGHASLPEKGSISLKKYLNEYMDANKNADTAWISERRDVFVKTVKSIRLVYGDTAFNNLMNDLVTLRKRFNPTVFDSLMVASANAIDNGWNPEGQQMEETRLRLLKDAKYREYITMGTMQVDHIQGRIKMALSTLYGN